MKRITDKPLLLKLGVLLLWAVACWLFFQLAYPHHLYYQEQDQLFLLSNDYVWSYMSKPAWVACLVGDFLTQFYYYMFAGATILTLALLVLGDLLCRGLVKAGLGQWPAFIIALVVMTLEACLSFSPEYHLSSILALTGGAGMFFVVHPHYDGEHRWRMVVRGVACVVAGMLTLWCFGSGLLVYLLLLLVQLCCQRSVRALVGNVAIGLVLLAVALSSRSCYVLDAGDLLCYPGLGKLQKPDFLLEKTFAVSDEYSWKHYQKVIQLVEGSEEKTDAMVFYYNLAQAQLGQLPENLLKMKQPYLGTFEKIGPETPRLIVNQMNDLYFALGDMMFTERAAMLRAVFSPNNRSVKMVKRLAECNIVSGDRPAATKYLRLLQKTFVYRDWANRALAGDRATIGYLLAKQPFVNRKDTLRTSDNAHLIMMELLDSNPNNELCLDYLLCSDLLLRDITTFKRDYDRYCMRGDTSDSTAAPVGRIRPIYQQALMIWLVGLDMSQEEWQRYIRDGQQVQRLREYQQQRGSAAFSDTYWYYFDVRPGK